jgi:pimeloyl-ACP methyl ester carboxylesterase
MPETTATYKEPQKETEKKGPAVILARGMEDLPPWVSGEIAKLLKAEAFNSNWKDAESFDEKLSRFKNMVKKLKEEHGHVVVIGVSAGAGLALALMLEEPDLIDHLYSCSGVLDPNLIEQEEALKPLTEPNPSFLQMCKHLTEKLGHTQTEFDSPLKETDRMTDAVRWHYSRQEEEHLIPPAIRNNNLAKKITAYSSLGESDTVVPMRTRMPVWVTKPRLIGAHNHVMAIAKTLINDVRQNISRLQ